MSARKVELRARTGERRRGRRQWVVLVTEQPVGLLGDELPWRGWRYGSRCWWSALRDMDDMSQPASWNTGLGVELRTRRAAVDALLAELDRRAAVES